MTRRLLTRKDLAAKLGMSVKWVGHNHARLTAEHRFPPAIGCFGPSSLRWDEAAVDRWFDDMNLNAFPTEQEPYRHDRQSQTD